MQKEGRKAYLTVDFEDYRRQELRDNYQPDQPPHPEEVARQADMLLSLFSDLDATATFFSVGRLVKELPKQLWRDISSRHELGCHGYEHLRVNQQGPDAFKADLLAGKSALEDASGISVTSYRAPYFSIDGCSPWFGRILAECGFRADSSLRVEARKRPTEEKLWLEGSEGQVEEFPLPAIGFGPKRLTIIGGTYFRLLPLPAIRRLLRMVEERGFTPMVYLHPYDIDPHASPLDYPSRGYFTKRQGDRMRRIGRSGTAQKLAALAEEYHFQAV
jgi:peptidoglycan/xylan/chitin deacetylase (PgdA/CDA1 family)